ncbi:uncharacterized protein N7459_006963 [Penicillium hispanicum]|uniref:uncharacterized protein n=1 Tax=Penicillium hispanicum TaxID=1080232 RepID=UPI00254245AD|nr:uncharacterized protein N7459_006963 [Penicillium hispanicum]KAJ5577999.1 hypothetical protein N7459_006963 [Penicillium hispanicum]
MNTDSPEKSIMTPTTNHDPPAVADREAPPIDDVPNTQHAPDSWSSMPKRKPVPAGPPVLGAATTAAPVGSTNAKPGSHGQRSAWLWPSASVFHLPAHPRSRRYLIIGIVAAIVGIALIIGLAVGLTVGKKKSSNLPLPSSNGGPYEGDLTYYNPALGSCGDTNSDSDMICAVSHVLFDAASTGSNPNANPLCGMKLRLRRDGKSVDVTVVDRCVGCAETDLDVTEAVFEKVANLDQGRVEVEWSWLEKAPVSVS